MLLDNKIDVLQPVSKEDLTKILFEIRKHLPKSIRGHHYIYNYLKNCEKINLNSSDVSDRCKPIFYKPKNGKFENCTYIAITPENENWIFLYTVEENGNELCDSLKFTNRINWRLDQIFLSVESKYFYYVNEILQQKRSDWIYPTPEALYSLPKEVAKSFDFKMLADNNLSLKKLTSDCAGNINEMWEHKYDGSLTAIHTMLRMNDGSGLYKNDKLVAWIAVNDFFAVGFLKSLTTERRKGYASIVLKSSCQRIANDHNVDILAHILRGNVASEKAFLKVGFQCVNEIRLIEIHKQQPPQHKL